MPMAVFDFVDINARLKRIARNDQIELKPTTANPPQAPIAKSPFPPAPNNPGHSHQYSLPCQRCRGSGQIGSSVVRVCPDCNGKGITP